jgi:hypothetical protein
MVFMKIQTLYYALNAIQNAFLVNIILIIVQNVPINLEKKNLNVIVKLVILKMIFKNV